MPSVSRYWVSAGLLAVVAATTNSPAFGGDSSNAGSPASGSPPRSSGVPEGAAGKEVTLRFAWPEGPRGTMRYTHSKSQGPVAAKPLSATWKVKVARDSKGLRTVTWSEPKSEVLTDNEPALKEMLEGMLPPITVDADGQFVGVPANAAESLIASMTRAAGKDVIPSDARATVVSMLNARSKNFWDSLVGRWTSKKLVVGGTYPVEGSTEIMPGLPAMKLSGSGRAKPCDSPSASCIVIEESSTASTPEFSKIVGALAKKMGGDIEKIAKKIRIDEVSMHGVLVTDPVTLFPKRFRSEKRLTMSFDGGAPTQQFDVEEWTFSPR